MISTRKQAVKHPHSRSGDPSEVTVYGHLDCATLDAIDRMGDQMVMPRSWVVAQILREWAERRSAEIHELEQSWNGSYREELGRHGMEG
ncbi:MAG TPA: hypothetical protein VH475_21550 [Tepidisphaeraceae bacterium]|jgi:hypothetical protein